MKRRRAFPDLTAVAFVVAVAAVVAFFFLVVLSFESAESSFRLTGSTSFGGQAAVIGSI